MRSQIPDYPRWFLPCVQRWLEVYQKEAMSFVDNAWDDDRDNLQVRRMPSPIVPVGVFTSSVRKATVPLGLRCLLDLHPQTNKTFSGYQLGYWPPNVNLVKNLRRHLQDEGVSLMLHSDLTCCRGSYKLYLFICPFFMSAHLPVCPL